MGPPRYGRLAKLAVSESVCSPKRIFSAAKRFTVCVHCSHCIVSNKLYGYRIKYRIKPYEQLVSVSLTSHNASTPDLSTSWSRTTLQGGLASGKTYLQAGFPLRCFQRLSLPDIATRQCDWHHNRYTSGPSTPVLSY